MRVWAWVIAAAGVSTLIVACGGEHAPETGSLAGPAPGALPEVEVCAACHPVVARQWLQHGMADAMGPLEPDRLTATPDSAWHDHPPSGARYRIESPQPQSWIVAEERMNPAPGLPPPRREMNLRARIGAGVQDLSFVAVEQGRWYFAPLEHSRTHGWTESPFQQAGTGSGLNFRITPDCLSCHTEAALPHPFPFHALGELPLRGISCAACHGDVSRHAADGTSPILNPFDLPPARQLDLCARCHLEGDAHIELLPESAPAFQPGADLLARRAVLVPAASGDEAPFVSQVQRLSLSACFRASPEMTCTSCHNPHLPLRLEERAARSAGCLDCHRELAHPPINAYDADCVECHMPEIEPLDLPGARIRDHWIRRSPDAPPADGGFRENEALDASWELFRYRASDPPRWTETEQNVLRAMALASQGRHAEAASGFAHWQESPTPASMLARLPMLQFMRGLTLTALDRKSEAEAAYRAALALAPEFAEARLNLGWLLIERGAAADALIEADSLRLAHRGAESPWLLKAAAHAVAGRNAEAMQALEGSLQAYGAQPAVLQRLSRAAAAAGDAALARRALLAAWSLDPRLPGLEAELRALLTTR
jgi:Flp pilus assembly protein TadD